MTRKLTIFLIAAVMAVAFMGAVAISFADVPETITIDKAQNKKPPVVFPHAAHAKDNDCTVCHHKDEGKEEKRSCFECHGKDENIPDPSVMSAKENPFHILCRECHKEKGQGPTKCNECHKE
ncbi:MAG: cytochrome c3 family protein [bacterium]|nr:MAG: cytochrome c3 family protein [bacterium]